MLATTHLRGKDRIRSPTPTPGESDGRGTGLPVRSAGGVGLSGQVVPNVPDRVDPSRADRHPIYPVRERSDSRSRRVRGLPDRSHSPPGRARDDPRARVRGDVSVSPNRNVSRNRSPRPDVIPDRRSEVRSRQPRGERPIRGSGSISPMELLRIVDRPQRRLQEGLPAVMAQTRQRFVPSMILTTVGARMLNSRV